MHGWITQKFGKGRTGAEVKREGMNFRAWLQKRETRSTDIHADTTTSIITMKLKSYAHLNNRNIGVWAKMYAH